MKTRLTPRRYRNRGLSLVELLTILLIIGLIVAIAIPNLSSITGVADKMKDKRNAQTVISTYMTGAAAGVQWPAGDVAAKVASIVTGRRPSSGVFSTTLFRASMPADEVSGIYIFIGMRPGGELFFDPTGGQNPSGH